MAYLLDTGILLRAFDPVSDQQKVILQAIDLLWRRRERLIVTAQNMAEFWNVSTRPIENNGRGLPIAVVARQVDVIESFARLLTENERSHLEWKRLVTLHAVIGAKVHDARLVAVMIAHGISNLLTLNVRDFLRFPGIVAVSPDLLPI